MKKNIINVTIKITINLIICILILSTFLSVNANPPMTIKVGIFDINGFYGVDELGKPFGYGYEYLETLAKYGNFNFEYVHGTWDELKAKLLIGEIDLLNAAELTEERAKQFAFSKYITGTTYGEVLVKADNNSISYNDFDSMNNIRVGLLKGNVKNETFLDFKEKNGFKTKDFMYDDANEQYKALHNNEIDALVTNNLRKSDTEKSVARFSPCPFYMITPKSKPEITLAIDNALERLLINRPNFNYELNVKYYSAEKNILMLTKQEQDYIKNSPPIKVVHDSFWYPFESYNKNTNNVTGINLEILEIIAKKTGLQFEYLHEYTYSECIEMVGKGQVDMLLSYDSNPDVEDKLNIALSDTFLTTPIAILGYSKSITDDMVFAIPKIYPVIEDYVRRMFPSNTIVLYDDIESCYEALANKKADITLENSYVANYKLAQNQYPNLSFVAMTGLEDKFSFAFKKDTDQTLLNIFNKTIQTISPTEKENILFNYSINQTEVLSFNDVVYQYKVFFMVVAGLFLLIIIVSCVIIALLQYKSKKALWKMAYVDQLTGLNNINKFRVDAYKILQLNKNKKYVCIRLDVENFKLINDIYGFNRGDEILKQIAQSIKDNMVDGTDTYARISSDNFIYLKSFESAEDANGLRINTEKNFLDKLNAELNMSVKLKFGRYYIKNGEVDISKIIENVNYAHHLAKNMPNKNICDYDDSVKQIEIKQKLIESRMEDALNEEKFIMYLQAKHSLEDESIVGAEALVRWIDNDADVLYPDHFIPLFEKNGFITKLDFYMLDKACQTIRKWIDSGIEPIPISVNFSRLHIRNNNFVSDICAIVNKHNISRSYIEIELTESTIFDNEDVLIELFNTLHNEGFTLSMDDFGIGYSSLGLLKNIPVDVIKIDRSFFSDLKNTRRSKIVISNVLKMANELSIKTVAEGVETKEHIDLLKELKCDIVQGYYYSRPIIEPSFTKNYQEVLSKIVDK